MNDLHDNRQTDDDFMRKHQQPQKASDRALNYMRDMYRDRDWKAKVEAMPQEWRTLFHQMGTDETRPYAHADCSKFIDMLKTCERIGKMTKAPIPGSDIAANPPVEDGIYYKRVNGKDLFYKVYWNNEKDRLLAKEIVLIQEATEHTKAISELRYRGVAYRFVTADDKYNPTLEEAIAFGPVYGRCMICGRNLNDEISVKLGIGPVCGGREFGDVFRTMHKMAKAELEMDDMGEDAMKARIAELEAELGDTTL